MLPIRFRPNVALLTVLLVAAAGCSGDRGAPVTTETDSPALATAPAATVSFACASGREIMVAYPDTGSVRLTYLGQEYAMAQTPVASGARYAGADMVWTSSVADDGERAVLSRVGADGSSSGTVLERCALPAGNASPQPAAPSETPVPANPTNVATGVPPCKGPQLKLEEAGGDAGMGNRVAIVGVRNLGSASCSLNGYPSISLIDDRNQPLATVKADTGPSSYFRSGQTPALVTLPPQGRAWFDIAWNVVPHEADGETVCPTAARVRMTAPNDTSPVWLDHPLTPCGGVVHVTPFRSVAEPAPPAS